MTPEMTAETTGILPSDRPMLDIDIFAQEHLEDPFPLYHMLRDAGPIVWLKQHNVWAVSRFADVQAILSDWRRFGNAGGAGFTNYHKEEPWRRPSIILEADPPLHTRTRTVLTRILSPAAIRGLKAAFEADAERLVGDLVARGSFDGLNDLTLVYPQLALPDCIGLAKEGRESIVDYNRMVAFGFQPRDSQDHAALAAERRTLDWIESACLRESLAPGSFGAQLYEAADAGELDEDEANLLVRSLLSAGITTTVNTLTNTLICLAQNPDQWAILRETPTLARAAFEEGIRCDLLDLGLFRTANEVTDYAGVRLKQHDKILLVLSAANFDPDRWENPRKYDISRRTTGHVGFGVGIHGCVAQMIARIEGEAVIGALARQAATIEISGKPTFYHEIRSRRLSSMPLTVTPA